MDGESAPSESLHIEGIEEEASAISLEDCNNSTSVSDAGEVLTEWIWLSVTHASLKLQCS